MPEHQLLAALSDYRRRFRIAGVAAAVILATALAGLVLGTAALATAFWSTARLVAVIALAVVGFGVSLRTWRHWSLAHVASALESRVPLDNLVITAEEVLRHRAEIRHDALRNEVFAGALAGLARVESTRIQPLAGWVAAAALSLIAIGALLVVAPPPVLQAVDSSSTDPALRPLSAGDLRVTVLPPTYTQRESTASINPTSVAVLEGSRVQLEVGLPSNADAPKVWLRALDGSATPFTLTERGAATLELTADVSRPLLVRQEGPDGQIADRLVQMRVERDTPAVVAIREPAKDLIFPEGRGEVALRIEANDDVGLRALALRYTKVSGSGETFTFEEGEWPISITREGVASWRAQAVLSLEKIGLQDGDTLVYRAVARDGRPGSDPSTSDSYLIEVGGLTGIAAQGFALPEERDRHAISQQMVIVKTERLHAARSRMNEAEFLEQSQLLAVEQRMVQAEFVFMTGGHVHDEVEEAEQSGDIAEGRLENSATVEMMNAIREMSRAETRLNAADTTQALTHERAALRALQRAFDRRRYFLRTLPDRARIDLSRRLTGELENARSSALVPTPPLSDPLRRAARAVLEELGRASGDGAEVGVLAARLLALQPDSETLQGAAAQMMSARDQTALRAAISDAQRAVVGVLQTNDAAMRLPLSREPVTGQLVQELDRERRPQ